MEVGEEGTNMCLSPIERPELGGEPSGVRGISREGEDRCRLDGGDDGGEACSYDGGEGGAS